MALKLFGLDHQEAAKRYQLIKWLLVALLVSEIILWSVPLIFFPDTLYSSLAGRHQHYLSAAKIFFMGLISLIIQVGFIWGISKDMLSVMVIYAVLMTIISPLALLTFSPLVYVMIPIPAVLTYYLIYLHMNKESQPAVPCKVSTISFV